MQKTIEYAKEQAAMWRRRTRESSSDPGYALYCKIMAQTYNDCARLLRRNPKEFRAVAEGFIEGPFTAPLLLPSVRATAAAFLDVFQHLQKTTGTEPTKEVA